MCMGESVDVYGKNGRPAPTDSKDERSIRHHVFCRSTVKPDAVISGNWTFSTWGHGDGKLVLLFPSRAGEAEGEGKQREMGGMDEAGWVSKMFVAGCSKSTNLICEGYVGGLKCLAFGRGAGVWRVLRWSAEVHRL